MFPDRASVAETTPTAEFMDRLTQCAGGIDVSIDANLLGSVRSIYDGDKTVGKAHLKTVAAFLQYIPDKDKLAALALYQKCIISLLGAQHEIKPEILNVRFAARIPTDMYVDLDNRNLDLSVLLKKNGGFFAHLFDPLSVDYRIMRKGCDWVSISKYNADHDYYFSHSFMTSLSPGAAGIVTGLSAETFAKTDFIFSGRDWSADDLAASNIPTPSDPLKSVDQLIGKCLYVHFFTLPTEAKNSDGHEVAEWLSSYGGDVVGSIRLYEFSMKLNDNYRITLYQGKYREVYSSVTQKIWEAPLPNDVNALSIK